MILYYKKKIFSIMNIFYIKSQNININFYGGTLIMKNNEKNKNKNNNKNNSKNNSNNNCENN